MKFQRLRDLREDKDLKQNDIAEMINISLRQYGLYERGKQDITLEKTLILANFYNVSIDYIAGRTNDKRGLTKSELPNDVKNLVENFMILSERRKGQIDLLMKQLIEEQEAEQASIKEVG